MANYYATARSNYFRIKDGGRERLAELGLTIFDRGDTLAIAEEDDGWPSTTIDGDEDIDLVEELAKIAVPGEIIILMEAGAERFRYVSGYAIAILVQDDGDFDFRRIGLDDIYDLAKEAWGVEAGRAEY